MKDLTVKSGSPLSRLLTISRFDDLFTEFDKLWKCWDIDMKAFSDLQPKSMFPKVNVSETDSGYEVEIALAGFDKEDINMELKDNCMFIKADKKEDIEDKKYIMKEISSRSFRRALAFPKKVIGTDIKCTHKDGIITCTLKKEVPVDDTVKINIEQ